MDFYSFIEGPLLWIVFLIFTVGIIARVAFFVWTIITSNKDKEFQWAYISATLGRLFVPFHKAIINKPFYATLRYMFHICLVVVPIWFSGHIALWAESRFEWEWIALPDTWADWMTLVLLALAIYFLIMHLAVKDVRSTSSTADYVLIVITALPFMTGYFLTYGSLDAIAFLGDNMRLIHVLSGEAMIVMAVFLFCRIRINVRKCTGCASCELSCPTGALESNDEGNLRTFNYSHYQCICCGVCVSTCLEEAEEIRHEISIGKFFRIVPKEEIRSIEMKKCEQCGDLFVAPEPQVEKVIQAVTIPADDYIRFCSECRKKKLKSDVR